MALIDVIKYEGKPGEIVWKFPRNDISTFGQLVVNESQEAIFLKQVVNTNKCVIQLEKVGSKLVVHSAIDNLLKGASGQAVQNMNLLFGFDEKAGLNLKATAF